MIGGRFVTALGPAFALAAAGLLFGFCYFAALKRTVDLYGSGTKLLAPTLLTAGRIAAVALFFILAAKLGALALLATFAGFLAARGVVLRRAWRTG